MPAERILRKRGLPYKAGYMDGDIANAIPANARKHKFDMTVMGSHGHGGVAHLVMGWVTTEVLAVAAVLVLIVR